MKLEEMICVPCRGGVAPLTAAEAEEKIAELPGWTVEDAATRISRTFRFPDFVSALGFARKVGAIAQEQKHHPDLALGWGYCKVSFQTHKIHGLHENDFIMAARVNGAAGA
jgi:4a-hydroxytetrahydrobiopterin dehydratase